MSAVAAARDPVGRAERVVLGYGPKQRLDLLDLEEADAGVVLDLQSGEYRGLVAGMGSEVPIGAAAVLVKAAVAQPLVDKQVTGRAGPEAAEKDGDEKSRGDDAGERPTRFYGRVELDPVRFGRQLDQISDEVIAHLSRIDGASVVLTFEIEASASEGFDDAARRAIGENASTLKFEEHRFED